MRTKGETYQGLKVLLKRQRRCSRNILERRSPQHQEKNKPKETKLRQRQNGKTEGRKPQKTRNKRKPNYYRELCNRKLKPFLENNQKSV